MSMMGLVRDRWDPQGHGNLPFRNLSYGHTVVRFICCILFSYPSSYLLGVMN